MSMIKEAEKFSSQTEKQASELERHIQKLEAAGHRALGLHEKIQSVLEVKREALRTLQTTTAVRPEMESED